MPFPFIGTRLSPSPAQNESVVSRDQQTHFSDGTHSYAVLWCCGQDQYYRTSTNLVKSIFMHFTFITLISLEIIYS